MYESKASILYLTQTKAAVGSPDASPQLQDSESIQGRQHGENLGQFMSSQLPGTRVQHHLLHCGIPGVLLPKLCHLVTH